MARPIKIARNSSTGLEVTWDDGLSISLSNEKLRRECPCAQCREKRGDTSHAKPLTPGKGLLRIVDSTIAEQLRLDQVWEVGNYAIGLRWGDGHDSGIYTFDYLMELGKA